MTFAEKKIEEFRKKYTKREGAIISFKMEDGFTIFEFENWLRKTIAEAEREGMLKLTNYFSDLQKKYEEDTRSLLCDYTLRKMIDDCQRKIKELERE